MDSALVVPLAAAFFTLVALNGALVIRVLSEAKGLRGEIGDLRTEMHTELAALRSEMQAGMNGLSERLVAVEVRLDTLESRFAST